MREFKVKPTGDPVDLGNMGVLVREPINLADEVNSLVELNDYEVLWQALRDGSLELLLSPSDLLIYTHIRPGENPLTVDFSILGLRKLPPSYDRGRKVIARYVDAEDRVVVSKKFFDIKSDAGELIGIEIEFNWFTLEGEIGLSKKEVVKEFNRIEAETIRRKRREKCVDYLIAGSKGTPIESYFNLLFDYYDTQILQFKAKGTDELRDAIVSEDNPHVSQVLNIDLPRKDGSTIKVRDSILYQISG